MAKCGCELIFQETCFFLCHRFVNHEKSKKHKENVAALQEDMRREDEDLVGEDPELCGEEDTSGVDPTICGRMEQEENDLEESPSKQK